MNEKSEPPKQEQATEAPYGQVTTHTLTGQQFFYRWPHPPYLDNASECVAVYLRATPAEPSYIVPSQAVADMMAEHFGGMKVEVVEKLRSFATPAEPSVRATLPTQGEQKP